MLYGASSLCARAPRALSSAMIRSDAPTSSATSLVVEVLITNSKGVFGGRKEKKARKGKWYKMVSLFSLSFLSSPKRPCRNFLIHPTTTPTFLSFLFFLIHNLTIITSMLLFI